MESIKKVYNENDHLYADANDFISTFILNINDDRERHMFTTIYVEHRNVSLERIMSLKKCDGSISKQYKWFYIRGYGIWAEDSWQCILSINDIRQGSGIDIHNNIYKINLDDYIPFE